MLAQSRTNVRLQSPAIAFETRAPPGKVRKPQKGSGYEQNDGRQVEVHNITPCG